MPIITLTTDFGLTDAYVGQMKGVILGISPDARIVDITHEIRSQQIQQAAFLTQTAWPAFPQGTIHVAVVDPGVGTERRAILLQTDQGSFLGPDNGVLSAALPDDTRPATASVIPASGSLRVFELSNEVYMRQPTSATFHGRDIFAPAAAHLSIGLDPAELGSPLTELNALPPFRAARGEDGTMTGQVVHVDRYGNVVTDIRSADLPEGSFSIEVAGHSVPGPYRTFADLEGLGAIVGSSQFLGIAAPEGDAAKILEIDIGGPVRLRPRS
ncbi:MAG: SAM-dependent chlorinase/fluorinase [Chloroflexi bacterium]|nr:SAM-dependent chlorinase/fluorinase [Chloroflexota bacterium]